ncbi:dihydrofolate reductase family protein [Gordonia asplenii]|uniref:dihydrofolate reductase family protein n=1 Tax=Gordonia asplenii TaxID=2725283 RepID=UPI0028ADF885|nr:dihydrofolate reductase family protein [Gordonia asplenii]
MFLLHKATQVTTSVPAPGADPTPWLTQAYAYPDADTPVLRVNFIATVDGAASVDGRSGGLGGDGDRLIFGVLRSLADAVIVGARTAVAENYHAPDVGVLYLVSASLSIPTDYETLRSPRVVVVTSTTADPDRRATLTEAGATIVDCGTDGVDMATLIAHCRARGQLKLLCEGGPSLFATLLADDLVDELCLTTAPLLAAGDGPRIAHGANAIDAKRVRLTQLLGDDDGYLYARWERRA